VNIGITGRPLVTEDPLPADVLPCDDALWDQGEITTSEPVFVSSPTSVRAGAFARTCQAAHLLGRVVKHQSDRTLQAPTRFLEAAQLHRTMSALSSLMTSEFQASPDRMSTATALCYGTLLSLYDQYACTESNRGEHTVEETDMQAMAIAGLNSISEAGLRFSHQVQMSMAQNLAATSPLIADCLYQTAASYAWLVRETGSPEVFAALQSVSSTLKTMSARWQVAGTFTL
jgi:hypothetical protein